MSVKGLWKGECFTPGCTSAARHIATAEGPRVEVPQERYRCARCCDLVGLAVPQRREAVYAGKPGWDEWCAELDAIFALPLSVLEKAAAGAVVSVPSGSSQPPFNGYPLLASAPRKDGNGHFIVVEYGSETVVADARNLTDSEWDNGHYCKDREVAMRDFVSRLVKEYGTEPPR